jgi:hypothetical protein
MIMGTILATQFTPFWSNCLSVRKKTWKLFSDFFLSLAFVGKTFFSTI